MNDEEIGKSQKLKEWRTTRLKRRNWKKFGNFGNLANFPVCYFRILGNFSSAIKVCNLLGLDVDYWRYEIQNVYFLIVVFIYYLKVYRSFLYFKLPFPLKWMSSRITKIIRASSYWNIQLNDTAHVTQCKKKKKEKKLKILERNRGSTTMKSRSSIEFGKWKTIGTIFAKGANIWYVGARSIDLGSINRLDRSSARLDASDLRAERREQLPVNLWLPLLLRWCACAVCNERG